MGARPPTSVPTAASDPAVADPAAAVEERARDLRELGAAFRRVAASLRRLRGRDTHLCAGELSHAQVELLVELYEGGELSAGDLASAAQLTPATVTQMLDHLASEGYVERTRLETDKRVVVSRLTERGEREIEIKRQKWQGRWERALADLDAEELRAATRVLARLRGVFEDV
jgi:DNA-binding MarR family transcriptional regulator